MPPRPSKEGPGALSCLQPAHAPGKEAEGRGMGSRQAHRPVSSQKLAMGRVGRQGFRADAWGGVHRAPTPQSAPASQLTSAPLG